MPPIFARRAISSERVIEPSYLDDLRASYYRLWASYTEVPIYVLDTQEINYVDSAQDRQAILRMIRGWLDGQPVSGSPASLHSEREVQLTLFSPGAPLEHQLQEH